MTRLQKFLDHCVSMALVDKAYAWNAAKRYAEIDKELAELPALLTAEMRRRNEVCSQDRRQQEGDS